MLDPLIPVLADQIHTIYLSPDAALAAVPWSALPFGAPGRLLLEDHVVIALPTAQDLVPWQEGTAPGNGALLLGGVDYGHAAKGAHVGGARRWAGRAPRGGHFGALPGTREEVELIASRFGKGGLSLLGSDATEARFRAASRGRRILHLATHGFVRDDLLRGLVRRKSGPPWLGADMERQLARGYDPLLLAGLAMAGANPREGGGGDDGILTALEASYLDLDGVELVVLSACESARGKAESGEGVLGLVQGFRMGGATRVMGSLWKVDDDATRALMVKFYELWHPAEGGKRGISAATALQRAMAFVRGHAKWRHPYYWAGWVLWGVP